MTAKQIIQRESSIGLAVSLSYTDPTGKADPIYDGIPNPEFYVAAPAKILWILKEPWDEADRSGGGWGLTRDCLDSRPHEMAKGPTFQPIIYVTYGLFNRLNWDRMSYIRDQPDVALVLRSIAFINVKKLPGLTRANNGEVLAAHLASREVILQQIRAYEPDYIFGCRPHMAVIMQDLGVPPDQIVTRNSVRYARAGNRLLLDICHPAQTTISRERYVNDIPEAVASQPAVLPIRSLS
jgi:hypothetical protein